MIYEYLNNNVEERYNKYWVYFIIPFFQFPLEEKKKDLAWFDVGIIKVNITYYSWQLYIFQVLNWLILSAYVYGIRRLKERELINVKAT